MSEPAITPLAQRLAEENNVDWRSLQGSGDAGRIVERDVLEYLARVMAGDEALNPTPEPLPEGLQEWPEADGWSGNAANQGGPNSSWDSTTPDGTDADDMDWPAGDEAHELGTPVAFDAEEAELRATGEYPAVHLEAADDLADDDELELSEDIFLFGDDSGTSDADDDDTFDSLPGLDNPLPPRQPFDQSQAQDDLDELAEEVLFLAEEPEGVLDGAEPAVYLDEDPEDDLALVTGLEVEPEEQLLGRSDDLLDDDEFEDADLTDLAMEDGELDEPGLAGESLEEFEAGFSFDSMERQAEDTAAHDDTGEAEPETGGDYAHLQEPDHFEDAQDRQGDQESDDEFDIDFGDLDDDANAGDAWQDAVEFAGDLGEGDEGERDEAEALARRIEAAFDSVADARPEFEGFDDGVEADDDQPVPVQPLAPAEPAGLPFAGFGTLLRRQLDVGHLNQARSLVGAEISGGDSVSALTFLLLAARRAAAETGLFEPQGQVAAAIIRDSHIELVSDPQQGFRGLARRLQQVASGQEDGSTDLEAVMLAVADMSGLEVDEAVLDLGMPMLSLGRSLHDEDNNTFRSTITLSGHFDLQTGARFLQAASELLANPLRLLL